MRRALSAVDVVAPAVAPVLLVGQAGTGKEHVARAIHETSARAAQPFVAVKARGVPEDRLEHELFGHDDGRGALAVAAQGTLYLDGVSDLGPALQARLCQVLDTAVPCSAARIISSTTRDLLVEAHQGVFREDLFYRLSVVTVELPALRERGDDVLLLARYFASRCAAEADRPTPSFSAAVLHVLRNYDWPGNVLELESVVHHLIVMSGGVIDVDDLPATVRLNQRRREQGLKRSLAAIEADHIRTVVEMVDGSRSKAAKILGIDRKTLYNKLRRLG
jgi:DNA-binding NtrC family response regulator